MPTVLIVDDARFSRNRLTAALKSLPIKIEEAVDGREALERIPVVAPDLMITDLLMPRMSGLELMAAVRATGNPLPLIVVSADTQSSSRAACRALGVKAFLNKPFVADDLRAAVRDALHCVPAWLSVVS